MDEEKKKSSILDTLSAALGMKKAEPPAPPKLPELMNTYDRLYVDLNGDLDLTNDPVVSPMDDTPEGLVQRYSSMRQCVVFDEISVALNLGKELGRCPIRLIPRVAVQDTKAGSTRASNSSPPWPERGKSSSAPRTIRPYWLNAT